MRRPCIALQSSFGSNFHDQSVFSDSHYRCFAQVWKMSPSDVLQHLPDTLCRMVLHGPVFVVPISLKYAARDIVHNLVVIRVLANVAAGSGGFAVGNESRDALVETEATGATDVG